MTDPISKNEIIGITPDGEKIMIEVIIGKPCQIGENEWSCSSSLKPLYSRLRAAIGSDSLQALCLSISLILDLLQAFREDGGRLIYDDGTDFPLEAYAFGFALNKGKA